MSEGMKEQGNEWPKYNLNEVYSFASGLSKSRDEFGYGYPFVSFKDVFQNFFLPKKLENLANTTEKERLACSVRRGDVFLTRTSETQEELGMSSVALADYPGAAFNGFTKRLRPLGNVEIFPEFAGFYFRSPQFRAAVTSMSSVTTRASLNNDMLSALKIMLPSPAEQEAIAAVLSSLDDKIDLLHRQNKTLEAMAETLFHQWFVEEAGDDWSEYRIRDFVVHLKGNIVPARSPDMIFHHYSLPAFDDGMRPTIEVGSQILSNKYQVEPWTLLVSKLNPRFPRIWPIGELLHESAVCSTEFQVFKPKQEILYGYIYFLFKSTGAKDELAMAASGTSGSHQRVRPEDILNIRTSLPSMNLAEQFSELVTPNIKKILTNTLQADCLEVLRDCLLPKLMSGEVRVAY